MSSPIVFTGASGALNRLPVRAISPPPAWRLKSLCFSVWSMWAILLCHAQQPQVAALPPQAEIEHNLVNVGMIYPPLLQEIRYATLCNFTGEVLYPFPTTFVHRDVAAALQKVQEELKSEGLCLKIFDGYRPFSVQKKMWALVPDERYVSEPNKSKGKHTRGTAVDVTLVDRMGNELKMPTVYDDFSDKAHRYSTKWTVEERRNSLKLESIMKKHNFIPFPFEWWHFDYSGWENYPPLDIGFEALGKGVQTAVPLR
jgi:zinc D-Ala-D-Ala dipeptidase